MRMLEVRAEAAFRAMATHFDGCEECRAAGAELADPDRLCDRGRRVLERWLAAEFGREGTARAIAMSH